MSEKFLLWQHVLRFLGIMHFSKIRTFSWDPTWHYWLTVLRKQAEDFSVQLASPSVYTMSIHGLLSYLSQVGVSSTKDFHSRIGFVRSRLLFTNRGIVFFPYWCIQQSYLRLLLHQRKEPPISQINCLKSYNVMSWIIFSYSVSHAYVYLWWKWQTSYLFKWLNLQYTFLTCQILIGPTVHDTIA